MTTEITVRGTYGSSEPPERATVHASIGYEGPSMEPVYARVVRDLEIVQASVAELKNGADAPVTWWSAEQLRTWSNRPWNQDGKQLPLVHHAGVNVEVKFRDFAALSSWVGEHISGTEGFQVGTISWALTAKRRDELIRQVRTRAVRDAVERAQLYADALGLGSVTPIAIADAGMLAADLHPADGTGRAYTVGRAAMSQDHRADIELVPQDIEVTASVDARFLVEVSRPPNSIVGEADPSEIGRYPQADPDAGTAP